MPRPILRTTPNPKYRLTDATRRVGGVTLRRIQALRAFADVQVGELGGWVQSESNLSQRGEAWLYHHAIAMQGARVQGNAVVLNRAVVRGHATVDGDAHVADRSTVEGHARVQHGSLRGRTRVFGHAHIACGQDGPPIYADSVIDFDVNYQAPYLALSLPLDWMGQTVCVSASGRVCFVDAHGADWSGDMRAWARWARTSGDPAWTAALAAARAWIKATTQAQADVGDGLTG